MIIKLNNIFFSALIFALFFIASCTQNQKNTEQDKEFQKMCTDSGYEWMLMKPTQDGKFIKDSQACWGCMVEGIEHVCDKEKFMEFVPPR